MLTGHVVNEIQSELRENVGDLQKMKAHFIEERSRLDAAHRNYESRKDWMDWIIFLLLLVAMIGIGFGLGLKYR